MKSPHNPALGEAIEIDLPAPAPETSCWLERIRRLGTAEALRADLGARYPALVAGRLRHLALVGAADEGRRLVALCAEHAIEIVAVADDNPALRGQTLGNLPIVPVKNLAALDHEIPVVIASHRPLQLVQRLRGMGFGTVVLFATLQAIDPVRFPPHMFYDGWLEDIADNLNQYEILSEAFDDDTSRRHLDAILGFRLTTDVGALVPVVDWDVYAPRDLISFAEDEVYVDAGAFDGDSIRVFIARSKGRFNRILAFEPDPRTSRRLDANFADEPRVEILRKGLHRENGILHFVDDGSRGAIFSESGDTEIPVTTLDTVLAGARVSFVKMNIEGAELDALRGAGRSIAAWKPRLAISAYHRPTDLWQVPFLMKELRPDYRLALRQHDVGSIETVAYGL